jgi:hypothetical protein
LENRVLLANNSGSSLFADSGQRLNSGNSYDVALGDADRDGDLDAFVANYGSQSGAPSKLWLNDGTGTFTNSGQNIGNSRSRSVALGDLDGDGDLDAFVGNDGTDKVWFNYGDGFYYDSFQALGSLTTVAVALDDLDGDGDLDAVTANDGNEALQVWLNNGAGRFSENGQDIIITSGRVTDVTLGDIDGDGDIDAVIAGSGNGGNAFLETIWLNNGHGVFVQGRTDFGHSGGTSINLGDLDNDGDLDAYVGTFSWDEIWLNDGTGRFADTAQAPITEYTKDALSSLDTDSVTLGDLDGDGDLDLFLTPGSGVSRVWWNDGDGYIADSGQGIGHSSHYDTAVGDLNNDGSLDVFIASGSGQDQVWFNLTGDGDSDPPSVSISGIGANPRTTPVGEITLVFSEPVLGVNLSDFMLSLDGGDDLLTGAETLWTEDNITWTLGPLGRLTNDIGNYSLSLIASNAGITDAAGNSLAGDATVNWTSGVGTTFTVTNTFNDDGGSLRQAILDANASPGRDAIAFNIPGTGPHTITLLSALPPISGPVILDATTEPDFAGYPVVTLNGFNAGPVNGIHLTIGQSVVRGLAINRFQGHGIVLEGSIGGSSIQGNYVGTDSAGAIPLANGGDGILVRNGENLIGGRTASARNLVSTNDVGVRLDYYGTAAFGNVVQGNYIGTNAHGDFAFPNRDDGVLIESRENVIGGARPGAGNIISGNDGWGVSFTIGSPSNNNNVIQGNLLGTDKTGTRALGNAGGIYLLATYRTVVGGTSPSAMNVISGNDGAGVVVGWSSSSNLIRGNHVGTDLAGTRAIPNGSNGISTANEISDNVIGGSAPGAGNVISANLGHGIDFEGTSGGGYDRLNKVLGNYIGTDRTGTIALGNSLAGVLVEYTDMTSVGNWIPGGGNIIANNGEDGVRFGSNFGSSGFGNSIVGNSIYANGGLGIDLGADGVLENDARDVDTGPNNLVNYPILTTAAFNGHTIAVVGTLNTVPNATLMLDFYASDRADQSNHGEGQDYLGSTSVTTNNLGDASFAAYLSASVHSGNIITATSTDLEGSTSEFSKAVGVTFLPVGDYNWNLVVDSADYNIWRASFGSTTHLAADGNGNGVVDAADYVVWRKGRGATVASFTGADRSGNATNASASDAALDRVSPWSTTDSAELVPPTKQVEVYALHASVSPPAIPKTSIQTKRYQVRGDRSVKQNSLDSNSAYRDALMVCLADQSLTLGRAIQIDSSPTFPSRNGPHESTWNPAEAIDVVFDKLGIHNHSRKWGEARCKSCSV